MNILLTGASSFTGYWFAHELGASGHRVVAPLRRAKIDYTGVRGERVKRLTGFAEVVWDCPFGESGFLSLLTKGQFDLLCHHATRVTDYRSPDFDVHAAFAENTKSLPEILRALRGRGLMGMVLTGSVFEENEGAGSVPLRAFSPYAVAKAITASLIRHSCTEFGIPFGKFVIPNPFGPYEEQRFCAYLINSWKNGQMAEVRTPRYVRDNIHVTLLAKAYADFARGLAEGRCCTKLNPSGYVENQGAFTHRVANEIGPRLGIECRFRLCEQTDISEPMVRINTDPVSAERFGWSEPQAWDDLANFYRDSPR